MPPVTRTSTQKARDPPEQKAVPDPPGFPAKRGPGHPKKPQTKIKLRVNSEPTTSQAAASNKGKKRLAASLSVDLEMPDSRSAPIGTAKSARSKKSSVKSSTQSSAESSTKLSRTPTQLSLTEPEALSSPLLSDLEVGTHFSPVFGFTNFFQSPLTPEPSEEKGNQRTDNLLAYGIQPIEEIKPKKVFKIAKVAKDANFTLTLLVTFGKYKVLEESSMHIANPGRHTFDYKQFASQEAKVTSDFAMRKQMGMERIEGRATILAEGKGFLVSRSVDGPDDWEEVEKIVRSWAELKRNCRVTVTVSYCLIAVASALKSGDVSDEIEEDLDQYENDRLGDSDEEKVGKKTRRTTTVILTEQSC